MNKPTIFALAIALTTGVGAALAQSGPGGTSGGPPNSPTAPSSPGPMPRDSGSSMGTGTMNPPTTVAPGAPTSPGTTATPNAPTTSPGTTAPGTTAPGTTAPGTTASPTPMPTQPQTAPSPSIANNPPAEAVPGTAAPTGRMAFGEAQARAKIEADGYKNVGQLTRAADGMWTGTAMRGSTSVQVMVDARGNVLSQ